MSDESVNVQITADASGLKAALREAAQAVAGGADQMKSALRSAAEGSEGLTDSIREFKSETVQSIRTSRFLTNELVEMAPGADEAKGAIRGLTEVFVEGAAGGLSFGLALAATKLAVGAVSDYIDRNKKVAREGANTTFEFRESWEKSMRAVEDTTGPALTTADAAYRDFTRSVGDELTKVSSKIHSYLEDEGAIAATFRRILGLGGTELDVLGAKAKSLQDLLRPGSKPAGVGDASKKENDQKDFESADRIITMKEALHGQERAEDAKFNEEINKILNDGHKHTTEENARNNALVLALTQTHNHNMVQLAHQLQAELAIAQAPTDNAQKLAQYHAEEQKILDDKDIKSAADRNARLSALSERYWSEEIFRAEHAEQEKTAFLDNLGVQLEAKQAGTAQKIGALEIELQDHTLEEQKSARLAAVSKREQEEIDLVRTAQQEHVLSFQAMETLIGSIHKKASDDRQKVVANEEKQWVNDLVRPIASSFNSTIKSMLDGSKSFFDALKSFAQTTFSGLIDGILRIGETWLTTQLTTAAAKKATDISQTQGSIAVAATEAAASVASAPFVGPILALSAAADVTAGLEALTAPMLSSAGGLDSVPSDGLMYLHKKETVMSAPLAETFRQLAANGGASGGGAPVHLYVQTTDPQSFEQYLSRTDVQRSISNLVRTGKWKG